MAKNTFHTSNATKWAAECSSPSSRPTLPRHKLEPMIINTSTYQFCMNTSTFSLSLTISILLVLSSQTNDLHFYKIKLKNRQTELLLTDVFTTEDMQWTRTRMRVTYWMIPDTATPVFDNLPHCYIIPDYICQIFQLPYTVIVCWAIKNLSHESIIVAELGSCLKVQVFLAWTIPDNPYGLCGRKTTLKW